jgi:hypothetical protein
MVDTTTLFGQVKINIKQGTRMALFPATDPQVMGDRV